MHETLMSHERFAYADVDFRSARVLDAGTGVGVTTARLAEFVGRAGGGRVVSVDADPAASRARRRLGRFARLVTFRRAELDDLSTFDDGSFDVVVCHGALSGVARRPLAVHRALTEFHRVLTPRGRLIVMDELEVSPARASRYALHFRRRSLLKALGCIVGERPGVELDPIELCATLSDLGFVDVSYRRFPGAPLTSEAMSEWAELVRERARRMRSRAFARAFAAETRSVLEDYARSGGHFPPHYVVKARKPKGG